MHATSLALLARRPLWLLGVLLFLATNVVAQQTPVAPFFALTDMQPFSVVVDAPRDQLFVSIPELNRIDVYSLQTHDLIDRIAIPSPAGMDLTLDGNRLIVGSGGGVNLYATSGTQFLSVIDPTTHKVIEKYSIPNVLGPFDAETNIPDLVVALANNLVVIRLGTYDSTQSALIKLDLNTGVFSRVKLPFGVHTSVLERVGPTTKVVITDTGNSGEIIVYDVAADQPVARSAFAGYFVWAVASPDGNRIVVSRGPYEVHIFDGQLNEVGIAGNKINIIDGAVFSSDSSTLYVAQSTANGVFYEVVDATTARSVGQVPGMFAEHGMAVPAAYDPHGFLVTKTEHGVAFIDATLRSTTGDGPGSGSLTPVSGPLGGGTKEQFSSVRLTQPLSVHVGARPASQIVLQSTNYLTFLTPAGVEAGPQDVVIDFLNGWRSYLPHAFTYGPSILYTDFNAGPVSGGTKLRIVGYGFGFTASQIQVTVGGQTATVDSVYPYSGISPWILPFHSIFVTVPPGSVGTVDISVTTPDGTTTLKNGFRYYSTKSNSSVSAIANNIIFDRWRNRVLVSTTSENTIDVLDATTLARLSQITSVTSPLGMSFTPDGTKLVVASAADELVVLDAITFADSHIPLSFPGAYGRPEKVFPETVAVGANGKALVGAPDFDLLDNAYLLEVDIATGEQKSVSASGIYLLSYLDLRQLENGSRILLTPLGASSGHTKMAVWDTATRQFTEIHRVVKGADVAVTDDAQAFAIGRAVLDTSFRVTARANTLGYTTPYGTGVFGLSVHPGGSLMLEPHRDSLWMFDMNSGAEIQRIGVPGEVNVGLSAMTVSGDGTTAYLLTKAGLLAVDLTPLPLTVGTVTPNEVSGASGAIVKVRGSGFRQGAQVFVDDEPVTTDFLNGSTLEITIPPLAEGSYSVTVKNIDDPSYTKPVALRVYGSRPIIKGVTPAQFDAGVGDVPISVFGLNFQPGSVLAVNGTSVQTTRNTGTDLSAVVPGSMLQSEGSVTLTVAGLNGYVSTPIVVPVKYPPGKWGLGTTELSFGFKHVGAEFSYDFRVYNHGKGPLFDVSVGLDAPAFSQTNDCPSTLMPTQMCTVHLTLDTSVARNADGVLHLFARNTTADVTLLATVVPPGPYLQMLYLSADASGWIGEKITAGFRLAALDQNVTVTAVRASDPEIAVSHECATVTTTGCGVGLSYVPTDLSTKDVTVTVESDASNSPIRAVVHFTGKFPVEFVSDELNMGRIIKGRPITMGTPLLNVSKGYVAKIQEISSTGPISAASQCGDTIAPSSTCSIDITVNPTDVGPISGIVKVMAADGTAQIPVSATVSDFLLQPTGDQNPSLTVSAGQTGTIEFALLSLGGFSGGIQLFCASNIPAGSCQMDPSHLTVDPSGAGFVSTLRIATTKRVLSQAMPGRTGRMLALSMSVLAFGILLAGKGRTRRAGLSVALLTISVLAVVSCGGGSGSSAGTTPQPPSTVETGTPSGTYTVTVTASYNTISPAVTRSIPVTVKVQ